MLEALTTSEFCVSPRSDRMAVMLGPAGAEEEAAARGEAAAEKPALVASQLLPRLLGGQQMSEACVSGTV